MTAKLSPAFRRAIQEEFNPNSAYFLEKRGGHFLFTEGILYTRSVEAEGSIIVIHLPSNRIELNNERIARIKEALS